jgi:RNA recognition motif-containing protein
LIGLVAMQEERVSERLHTISAELEKRLDKSLDELIGESAPSVSRKFPTRKSYSGSGNNVISRQPYARENGNHISSSYRNQRDEYPSFTNRVYVGNLWYKTTWQALKDHFRKCGNVIYADVFNKGDGLSKGCGIVEYSNHEDAQNAIRTLNDSELDGRLIFVREDREDRKSPLYRRNNDQNKCKIIVRNLPYEVGWQQLKDVFRQVGSVLRADISFNSGEGMVLFERRKDAYQAVREFNGQILFGRRIEVIVDEFST